MENLKDDISDNDERKKIIPKVLLESKKILIKNDAVRREDNEQFYYLDLPVHYKGFPLINY